MGLITPSAAPVDRVVTSRETREEAGSYLMNSAASDYQRRFTNIPNLDIQ
jgi:hypothetical protein